MVPSMGFDISFKSYSASCEDILFKFKNSHVAKFIGQQLWKLSGTKLENKAGIWKSDANWTLPTVGAPGNIMNTITGQGRRSPKSIGVIPLP